MLPLLRNQYRLIVVLTLMCLGLSTHAQEKEKYLWAVKLEKKYSKSFPVSNETIALLNRYGQLKIDTWDKNEVQVDGQITVGAQNNEYANNLLEKITIVDEKTTGKIEFKTQFDNWNDNSNHGGHEMRIDITVHLPATAKLFAENNFGPLTIGDYKGEVELVCKYGTLTAGKLSNPTSVTVEFGSAKLESVNNSKLVFKYSKVDITKLSGNIEAEFQFCNSIDLPVDNSLQQLEAV